jgi:hypothetical protein
MVLPCYKWAPAPTSLLREATNTTLSIFGRT